MIPTPPQPSTVLDLSHEIRSGMTVYPGDPSVVCGPALTMEADGVAVTNLRMGSHTGTHVDAPAHTVVGGRTMSGVALEELSGDALVLHVADRVTPGSEINAETLGLAGMATVPRIVLVHTGWDHHFGSPDALNHPFLARSAVEALWSMGMRVLGTDALSPDRTEAPSLDADPAAATSVAVQNDFPAHEVVLGGDGLIVENLRGLEQLGASARVAFFPLPIDGDGAPVRAVAWV